MFKNRGDITFKEASICSVVLHMFVLICGVVDFLSFSDREVVIMDVDIAGMSASNNAENDKKQPEEKLEKDQPPEPPQPENVEDEKVIPENDQQEKQPENQDELDQKQEEPTDTKEDPVSKSDDKMVDNQEEPVPKIEPIDTKKEQETKLPVLKQEEKPVKTPEVKKKKSKLKDVIKKVEIKDRKKIAKKLPLKDIAGKNIKKKSSKLFDDISKDLDKLISSSNNAARGASGNGLGNFGDGHGITDSDGDMISAQIYPHWVVPAGLKGAEKLVIDIKVCLKDSGEVIASKIKVVDVERYNADDAFKSAADSAIHAILASSPLKIPREKMDFFREFTFRFNVKEALGG